MQLIFKQELLHLICSTQSKTSEIDQLFRVYSLKGISRKQAYDVVWEIFRQDAQRIIERIPEAEINIDWLGEVETGLTGWCAADCIIRFQGEPEDLDELEAYVRGNEWK